MKQEDQMTPEIKTIRVWPKSVVSCRTECKVTAAS